MLLIADLGGGGLALVFFADTPVFTPYAVPDTLKAFSKPRLSFPAFFRLLSFLCLRQIAALRPLTQNKSLAASLKFDTARFGLFVKFLPKALHCGEHVIRNLLPNFTHTRKVRFITKTRAYLLCFDVLRELPCNCVSFAFVVHGYKSCAVAAGKPVSPLFECMDE